MSYLLFNNDVYLSDGNRMNKVKKEAGSFRQLSEAHLCVVDADILIASASENALDKKDSILAKKFSDSYQGEYILQDERIDNNIFQVIGIKTDKVREVYSLLSHDKIVTFVPYAVAARKLLSQQRFPANKVLVLLDDLGSEKLITVFKGLKFSRTRTIVHDKPEQILPEIKRSVINFEKKLAEQKDKNIEGLIIVTNNKILGTEFKEIEKDLSVEIVDSVCFGLEGLRAGGFVLKYILPEEIIKRRRRQESRQRMQNLIISVSLLVPGTLFFFYNRVALGAARNAFKQEEGRQWELEEELNKLDPFIYRNMLERQKKINYALYFLNTVNSLPVSYEVHSFSFERREDGRFDLEEYLYSQQDGLFDPIVPIGPLKRARINDFLAHNRAGKYLRIEL
ncbi:MAG: hypothetical protein KGK03_05020 [Candidatus Omnitrophica bacterium]|nr:hypothetical protein [Candidatus Omnitrophota bacterium]MDE2222416.1 hypothetical protein [Candidatus Omnitrophota bacterium]